MKASGGKHMMANGQSAQTWQKGILVASAGLLLAFGACTSSTDPAGPAGTSNLVVDLQDLKPSLGAISPAFDPATQSYTVTVGNNVSSVMVTAIVADDRASLKINDQPAASGHPYGPIQLVNRTTSVPILVEALGLSKSYQVTITKEPTPDLQDLKVSAGALSPAFAPARTSYTVRTGFSTTTTTVTATVTDDTATLTINGEAATSGQPTRPFNLQVGKTTIPVVVTASNSQTKTYQVEITREGNTDLANLQTSAGPIAPAFDPKQHTYTASTGFSTTQATITVTTADSTATVTINDQPATSGQAAGPFGLAVGSNPFTIVVSSPFSSVPPTTYTLTITRGQPPTNALLSDLAVSPPGGTVAGFDQNISGPYSVTVASTVTSVVVTATKEDASATMSGDVSAPPGQATGQATVTLNPAGTSTTISILVVAQDGVSSKSYTVIVNRTSGNANLKSLTVSPGSLQPAFNKTQFTYNASVTNGTSSIQVTAATEDPSATMTINTQPVASGQPFTVSNLQVGNNTITIRVTAPAGNFQNYVVNVNRDPSTVNTLKSIFFADSYLFEPQFSPGTTNYTVWFSYPATSTWIIAEKEDSFSTMSIQVGSDPTDPLTSGVRYPAAPKTISFGTAVTIRVRSQGGDTRTYTFTLEYRLG